ncbi:MAG TPA: WecB/TagA/CpsF family glycosyltransferase [Chloroflexota bacterium]|jgi:N-acetylglucosaminyldiphosphoundecaprenol N-acetyl-beta-D-mannosaminyltransferase
MDTSLADLGFSVRAIDVLGVRIHDVTLGEAVAICRAAIRADRPLRIVTPNAEFVMAAQKDTRFRETLNASSLAIPDGAGLLLAGRLLRTPLREQVAGTDLADRLAELSAAEGHRLFLLGAPPGVAEAAALRLVERHPGLIVAGTFAGDGTQAGDAETRTRLRQAGRVDVILVAYGVKKQEAWMARNQQEIGIPVAMGVGGVFDFFSGRVPRAPALVRRAGFDWLFRLIVQPWRWRRQLALPRFVAAVTAAAIARRVGAARDR